MNKISDYVQFEYNGKIFATGFGVIDPSDPYSMYTEGKKYPDTHYVNVDFGRIEDRVEMNIVRSLNTFTGLPLNTEVWVDGKLFTNVAEGSLTFEKPNPLDFYQLKFVNFPYMDFEVTL